MPNHQRGNRPPDDPLSTCPDCGRYMQGVDVCWKCGYNRVTADERIYARLCAKEQERELEQCELLAKADSLLALPDEQLQAKINKCLSRVEGFELETDESGKPERTSLARLIGRYVNVLVSDKFFPDLAPERRD